MKDADGVVCMHDNAYYYHLSHRLFLFICLCTAMPSVVRPDVQIQLPDHAKININETRLPKTKLRLLFATINAGHYHGDFGAIQDYRILTQQGNEPKVLNWRTRNPKLCLRHIANKWLGLLNPGSRTGLCACDSALVAIIAWLLPRGLQKKHLGKKSKKSRK
jgi:hypothetical protein